MGLNFFRRSVACSAQAVHCSAAGGGPEGAAGGAAGRLAAGGAAARGLHRDGLAARGGPAAGAAHHGLARRGAAGDGAAAAPSCRLQGSQQTGRRQGSQMGRVRWGTKVTGRLTVVWLKTPGGKQQGCGSSRLAQPATAEGGGCVGLQQEPVMVVCVEWG